MASGEEWACEDRYYAVTITGDGLSRDGLGWELEDIAPAPGRGLAMEVFRDDSKTVPVLSCRAFIPTPKEIVDRFTQEATVDLLADVLNQDRTGWLAANIARALALTGQTVLGWSGLEWAIPTWPDEEILWSDGDRVPFDYLRGQLTDGVVVITTYQDDHVNGLRFEPAGRTDLGPSTSETRPQTEASLPIGSFEVVEVVVDTTVRSKGWDGDAVLSEVTFQIAGEAVLLLAAEAEGEGVWKLYDESVVVLRDPSAADRLEWFQPRPLKEN